MVKPSQVPRSRWTMFIIEPAWPAYQLCVTTRKEEQSRFAFIVKWNNDSCKYLANQSKCVWAYKEMIKECQEPIDSGSASLFDGDNRSNISSCTRLQTTMSIGNRLSLILVSPLGQSPSSHSRALCPRKSTDNHNKGNGGNDLFIWPVY